MNSVAFELGEMMAKKAAGLGGIDMPVSSGPVAAAGAAPAAGGAGFKGIFPHIRNLLMGPKTPGAAGGGIGRYGKLGLLAAGGLGLWNMSRTGSPLKHDVGYGGSPLGSSAAQIASQDPLAQFGGMDPASGRYWDAVTMAALQRESQSQNALERIRMLRRLGTGTAV